MEAGITVSKWLDVTLGPPEIRTMVNGFRQKEFEIAFLLRVKITFGLFLFAWGSHSLGTRPLNVHYLSSPLRQG